MRQTSRGLSVLMQGALEEKRDTSDDIGMADHFAYNGGVLQRTNRGVCGEKSDTVQTASG